MIEQVLSSLDAVAVGLGAVASAVAIVLVVRHRQLARPKLCFRAGPPPLDYSQLEVPRRFRRKPPKVIVLVPESRLHEPFAATMVYSLENSSREPIRNVRLQLEYDREYLVDEAFFEELSTSKPVPYVAQSDPSTIRLARVEVSKKELEELRKLRRTSTMQHRGIVQYDLPLLRPGEHVLIWDIVLLRGRGAAGADEERGGSNLIADAMRKVADVSDYLVVTAIVMAENLEKTTETYSVIGLREGSDHEQAVREAGEAFWGGLPPTPGRYVLPPWPFGWLLRKRGSLGLQSRNLVKQELGLLIWPAIGKVETSDGQELFVHDVDAYGDLQAFLLGVPNCDYHHLPSWVRSHQDLMRWLGVPGGPLLKAKTGGAGERESGGS